jgi:hypothetical protein
MGRMKAEKVFLGMLRIRLPDKRLILELDAWYTSPNRKARFENTLLDDQSAVYVLMNIYGHLRTSPE